MRNKVKDYLERGLESIPGWMGVGAAQLFLALDYQQRKMGLEGDLFEIGVHQGRSAILLGLMAEGTKSRVTVCDLFSNQEENTSNSGRGNREAFEINWRNWIEEGIEMELYECLSSRLWNKNIGRNYRLFHIDGGHTSEETINDLDFAESKLVSGGLILLDDSHNYRFPGVSEGLIRFLCKGSSYVPLVIGKNKTVLCEGDKFERFKKHVLAGEDEFSSMLRGQSQFLEQQRFFGKEVLIYGKRR